MWTGSVNIPVGNAPGWETKVDQGDVSLNNIPDSSAIHFSLSQSRNAWLTSVFPKFASKSRAKGQKDLLQPPHNLAFISKCDIEIGPHVFADTSIYEAQYLPEPQYTTGLPSHYPPTSYNPYTEPSGLNPSRPTPASSVAPPADPSLNVTPALIAQVNDAAASNPTLHNLLQVAASGEASMDQLKTLGFFIQSLAAAQQQPPPPPPTANFLGTKEVTPPQSAFAQASQYSPPQAILKKPDIVLEFRDNHLDRFLVPREIVACELETGPAPLHRTDVVLYTFVPFINSGVISKAPETASGSKPSRSPAVIRLINTSDALCESVRGWVNEEAKTMDAWETFYDKTEASTKRSYLQYQLPNGDLLSQLRNACNNGYMMKSIKPTATPAATSVKRVRSRKPAQVSQNTNPSLGAENTDPQGLSSSGKPEAHKRRKPSIKSVAASTPMDPPSGSIYFINAVAAPLPPVPPQNSQPVLSLAPPTHPLPQTSTSAS